jgi:aspartate kinase
MMTCIIQKYGGSSLSDIDKIKTIAQNIAVIKKSNIDIVVVVSAMGKSTNNLVSMANEISSSPSRREMDMLLTTGERVSMSLLSIALQELGIDAVSLTGSQCGIITNHRHSNARVIEVRPFRIQDELSEGKVVIVGGFQGVSYKRDITTLGRGGSDTTAVALAAALDADRCEIYSDVDGVYSADPSKVQDAEHLPEISYQVMQEMSCAGAKVLHADAVEFAKEKNIAIYTRSTFKPGKETIIRQINRGSIAGISSVVSEENIVKIKLEGDTSFTIFQEVVSYLESKDISIKELHCNDNNSVTSFIISKQNIYEWDIIKEKLYAIGKEIITCNEGLSTVSLIGEGMNQSNKTLLDTISLLDEHDISILGVTTTSFRISLIVKKEVIEQAITLCHEHFINL